MSHWTKVKTKLRNEELIKKALDRMGISYVDGEHTIRYGGQSEKAQLKLSTNVGLSCQRDGTYAMVGDFWTAPGRLGEYYHNNEKFNADLSTAYSIEESKEAMEEQGLRLIENEEAEVGDDGLIRMVYETY